MSTASPPPIKKTKPAITRSETVADKPTRFLQNIAHLATILGVTVGGFALAVQANQYTNQVQLERELAISDRWQDHIQLSLQYPKFAAGKVEPDKLEAEEFERYIWFSENLIYAAEQILQYAPNDLQWRNALLYELRTQRPYIMSDEFLGCDGPSDDGLSNCSKSRDGDNSSSYCTYIPILRRLIKQSFADDRTASVKLKNAEATCHWDQDEKIVGAKT